MYIYTNKRSLFRQVNHNNFSRTFDSVAIAIPKIDKSIIFYLKLELLSRLPQHIKPVKHFSVDTYKNLITNQLIET